ncbi:MAG TPA: xanthine dehydrogenase family protein subunit M [Acidimicrobiales bacterium]|nr:xanthine dehydrogenase family protein subunit M [Acidimicrobiales bacterium]
MIPAAFDYLAPTSVDDVVAALAEHGEDAKVLAGGHSLLPLMKLRFAVPSVVVDIGRVDELRGVTDAGDHLVIGAGTTHHEVVHHPLVREHCGLLAEATSMVGDAQVRHRGTIGGATAHGDSAGDLPAVMAALDATFVAQGPGGRRDIPAAEFFQGYLETALAPDEVLVQVQVPKLDGSWGHAYEKFSRVSQAWAIVGVAALVRRENGSIAEARVGLTNMDAVPVRASAAEQALAGTDRTQDAIRAACGHAADGTNPPADLSAQPDYRQHLARVLSARAVQRAAG